MIQIDIIIISFARDEHLRSITENCIKSLISSEDSIKFNIFLIESNPLENFKNLSNLKNLKIIHPKVQFGYNRYLNIGINSSTSNYLCLCNNDLIFTKGWATNMLLAMEKDQTILSASPYSTNPHKTRFNLKSEDKIEYGYDIRRYLAGWCIFQKRQIYSKIGPLDEQFMFWYADNDYSETLKKFQIKHALVLNSIVEHVESKTLNTKDQATRRKLTTDQKKIFENKWKKR